LISNRSSNRSTTWSGGCGPANFASVASRDLRRVPLLFNPSVLLLSFFPYLIYRSSNAVTYHLTFANTGPHLTPSGSKLPPSCQSTGLLRSQRQLKARRERSSQTLSLSNNFQMSSTFPRAAKCPELVQSFQLYRRWQADHTEKPIEPLPAGMIQRPTYASKPSLNNNTKHNYHTSPQFNTGLQGSKPRLPLGESSLSRGKQAEKETPSKTRVYVLKAKTPIGGQTKFR